MRENLSNIEGDAKLTEFNKRKVEKKTEGKKNPQGASRKKKSRKQKRNSTTSKNSKQTP